MEGYFGLLQLLINSKIKIIDSSIGILGYTRNIHQP